MKKHGEQRRKREIDIEIDRQGEERKGERISKRLEDMVISM